MTKAEKMRRWYQSQRQKGRCLLCNKKRTRGSRSYCERHLLYFRLRRRAQCNLQPWREGFAGRPPIAAAAPENFLPSPTRKTPGNGSRRPLEAQA